MLTAFARSAPFAGALAQSARTAMADDEEMEVEGKEGPRFVVKKWNAVTFWSWDICTDTCAICRNKLYEPSIEAQANPGLADDAGYSIAWGCCGHVFHLDCISRWLKTRSVCPLCNREWECVHAATSPARARACHAAPTRARTRRAACMRHARALCPRRAPSAEAQAGGVYVRAQPSPERVCPPCSLSRARFAKIEKIATYGTLD